MKKVHNLLVLLLFCCFIDCGKAQGRKFALIVGAGIYPQSSHWPATFATQDAQKLADAFEKNGWRVTLCTTDNLNEPPSFSNLLRYLGLNQNPAGNLIYQPTKGHFSGDSIPLHKEDQILFLWGGHGLTLPDIGGDFIVPTDVVLNNLEIANPERLLSVDKIQYALKKTGAGRISVLLDACRVDLGSKLRIASGKVQTAVPVPLPQIEIEPEFEQQLFIMHSADKDQYSHDDQDLGGGVFSYFLIQLLTDMTAQETADVIVRDNAVSYQEAAKYLEMNTWNYVHAMPSKKTEQRPDYVFGRVNDVFLNASFLDLDGTEDQTGFDTWIQTMIAASENDFDDLKAGPIDGEFIFALRDDSIHIFNASFKGTYERDFAERPVLVFRSKSMAQTAAQSCKAKMLSRIGAFLSADEKRHADIDTYTNQGGKCTITLIFEDFAQNLGRITVEIRKNKT